MSVWIKLVTSFSLTPLRMATFLGLAFAMVGFFLAAGFSIERLTDPETPLGWASLIVSVLILGGVQLVSVGLLGEYLGRVFMHINERPQWVVGQVCGNSVSGRDPAKTESIAESVCRLLQHQHRRRVWGNCDEHRTVGYIQHGVVGDIPGACEAVWQLNGFGYF